jgi:tRNA A-37 threonylcarbamoyl transferase component Bud32
MIEPAKARFDLQHQVLDYCRHIAGSSEIIAVSLVDTYSVGQSNAIAPVEAVLVVRGFQPRLMSHMKVVNDRNIIVVAVDQWIFERDVDHGFLGESLASTLVFPHVAVAGNAYLHAQEVVLKKRLIRELLENLILDFPELSDRIRIKPEYFMYEVMLDRVRVFPPLAYGASSLMLDTASNKETSRVLHGYVEALKQLEKEKRIVFYDDYLMISKKLITETKKPKGRLASISKNTPKVLFTSVFQVFPQLLNFLSQNTAAFLKLDGFPWKTGVDEKRQFIDPQKYVLIPTAEGVVSLADKIDIEGFAQKTLLDGKKGKIAIEPLGGVLNDIYLIKTNTVGKKKVIVKRFKDWSGLKWFPLNIWSRGTVSFAVAGQSRLERECATSELLLREGFNVPRVLHVSNTERLVFMEFVEGENLSNSIKRIAASETEKSVAKELSTIARVGEILAQVHSLNVALGDTKPENVIVNPNETIYLLDFEQASRRGDKAWDVAEFLYYSGHYLQPLPSDWKAESITKAFISGYLKGGGDATVVHRAGAPKYTRVFNLFTMPSVIRVMSDICRKIEIAK